MIKRFPDNLAVFGWHLVEHADLQRPWELVAPFQPGAHGEEPAGGEDGCQLLIGVGFAQIAGAVRTAFWIVPGPARALMGGA